MTDDARTLTMTRRYDAPRDLVWKVWTDPAHVARWWGAFGPEETRAKIDLKVGGAFYVAMRAPDGSEHPSRGIIREIIPGEKLVIIGDADATDACGAGLPPRAVVTVLFEEDGAGTRLSIEAAFANVEALEAANASGYSASWTQTLDDLRAYLENETV